MKGLQTLFSRKKMCLLYSDQMIATQRLSRLVGESFCSDAERDEDE